MTQVFRGSHSVTVTPFTADGTAIDEPALRRFLDWQIASGVPGVIILGTTGEFLTVSDEERRRYVGLTVEHVAGRCQVMVGASNAYTPNAVRYAREAEELGAGGLMISPPYYYTPTEDEIFAYYKAIAEASSLPIMLYNNPVTTNVKMKPAFVARLTKAFETVRYIKEASLDVGYVYDIVELTNGVMNVFAGERIVESYLLGARRLRQSLRQLHPARLVADLGLSPRRADRRCARHPVADHPDGPHHRRRSSDLRPPVLFEGAGPPRAGSPWATCAPRSPASTNWVRRGSSAAARSFASSRRSMR